MKITRTFTRRSGEKLVISVEIDEAKVAEHMAHQLARTGKAKATAMTGGVKAEVIS